MKAAKDAVVKIDKELLKTIEEFITKNKFLYSSKKQVVNLAIIEFLNVRNSHKNKISEQLKNPPLAESFLNARMLDRSKKEGGKKRQDG